jgi:hypothetical protein
LHLKNRRFNLFSAMRLPILRAALAIATLSPAAMGQPALAGHPAVLGNTNPPVVDRQLQASYRVQAGLNGELYPVFANYASLQSQSERRFGALVLTISNLTSALLRQRIAVSIVGWSDQEIQTVELAPGAARTLLFAPSFLPRFYQNREIVAATASISVTDVAGRNIYETTAPVRLRSGEDIYWGHDFEYAAFIASWVTPHDARVEALLAEAKEFTADRRLPGYEDWKTSAEQERETYREAEAIFLALKRSGLSYVKSSQALGGHQSLSERVRMPRASLENRSANCIDAAVMYASLFENLGMDAEVLIVPGHAYVGVRTALQSPKWLLIDAALTGRSTFAAAVASAERGMARQRPASVRQVRIAEARASGIYPMP